MEFAWTKDQIEYRERVRKALDELLPADWDEKYVPESYASDLQVEFSRKFCADLAERGLLMPHWPKEYGGSEAPDWYHFILGEEMKGAGEPRGSQYMNVNWIGPTLMRYGSENQKKEHVAGIASGKVIWCQGFSEPNAGTDLAALKTRAVREGDHYVVNGSKIWTSYARGADWCFLLTRTGSERKALTILLVPMDTPGISVTSFPGLIKDGHLNEVFFTDVKVPVGNRLGEEGQAWEIVTHALAYERVGVPRYHTGLDALDLVVAQLKRENRWDNDPVARSRAGMIVAKFESARMMTYLVVDQRVRRMPPNTDANLSRVVALDAVTEMMNFIADYAPDCLAGGDMLLEDYYRINIPAGITGGTNEIQLDLVATGGLGLPRG
ncbi:MULTISPECIES: acyl-CoA dehydrogenase family protein [unclassified Novosphingobium]|uniref:acyl-CoA dehydrogenase family protein n=1 Tax=unclassified Novosphingobium TaxID=2644732 RepID=UPI000D3203D0|nr:MULTISPECIES: acyl-CoA dehydrogenase family protein [unclassified Novosphingobium]PTR12553.1 alkylation response protein AidB-like acyl-CoA dehydrogenase [Novosphingobium sp. GV055]PUB06337.1 alkylation response protein AidB-like acyl-CoA dehydrogenase [Novosphingobium sp. GV061]PUB22388.1 alkylation response protein AidB-like acyl-CoA dehydrogenase [Novosphingobium sp. GV079]PUB44413.1 alkylation response protein AidB-like acyl-CoA dehydrogenase [Novosphingobium sp. GV027]